MRNTMKSNYRLLVLISFDMSKTTEDDIRYVIDAAFELFTEDIDISFGYNSIKIECDTDMDMSDYLEVFDLILGSLSYCQLKIVDNETKDSYDKSYFNLENSWNAVDENDIVSNLIVFGNDYIGNKDIDYDLDFILDKINSKGIDSLSEGELEFLKKIK